jgi:hypothetical protein
MSKHTNNIDDFVKNQVKGLSNIGGITSSQSVKTTARSTYESPISIIPEEGVFAKSFVKSFKEQYKPVKPAKLDTTVDIFNSVEGNEFLLDEGQYLKLKNNDFLSVDAKEYFKNYQSLYNQAVKRGDKETQQQILGQLLNDKKAYTNLAAYLEAVGDDQLYDSKVSDASFLDVNGNKIDGLSLIDFVKINNSDPKSIKKSRKLNAAGVMKSGFDVTKDGQVFFINTEAMDSEYLKDNFKLKYNFYNTIQNAKFGSVFNKQLSTPTYNTDADGNVLTNVPTNTWYNSIETGAENFAKNQFREVSDDNFPSAYMTVQGLVNNGSFVLDENITNNPAYKEFLNEDGKIKEDKLKTIVENNKQFALDIVSDYIKQEFLTSRAGVGYNKQNGRAVRKGDVTTEKPGSTGNNFDSDGNNKNRRLAVRQYNSIVDDPELYVRTHFSPDTFVRTSRDGNIITLNIDGNEQDFNLTTKAGFGNFLNKIRDGKFGEDNDDLRTAFSELIQRAQKNFMDPEEIVRLNVGKNRFLPRFDPETGEISTGDLPTEMKK